MIKGLCHATILKSWFLHAQFLQRRIVALCGRVDFMHVIPNVATEAFMNQIIRSKFLTCQILSPYK